MRSNPSRTAIGIRRLDRGRNSKAAAKWPRRELYLRFNIKKEKKGEERRGLEEKTREEKRA